MTLPPSSERIKLHTVCSHGHLREVCASNPGIGETGFGVNGGLFWRRWGGKLPREPENTYDKP